MTKELPFTEIRDIPYTRTEDWVQDLIGDKKRTTPAWKHTSGLILAVRGPTGSRITLHEPYEDPRKVEELDGMYYEGNAVEYVRKELIRMNHVH